MIFIRIPVKVDILAQSMMVLCPINTWLIECNHHSLSLGRHVSERLCRYYTIQLLPWLLFLSIDYIVCLTTLLGEHCVFLITIQTCTCNILLLRLLRYGLSRRYLYALLIFLFVEFAIQNSTGWLLVIDLHQVNR